MRHCPGPGRRVARGKRLFARLVHVVFRLLGFFRPFRWIRCHFLELLVHLCPLSHRRTCAHTPPFLPALPSRLARVIMGGLFASQADYGIAHIAVRPSMTDPADSPACNFRKKTYEKYL